MTRNVYLVGAGPGAVDLLTLRAARLLERADYVLHDALVSGDVLALCAKARKIPVGKRAGRPSTEQGVINRLLVAAAQRFDVVVRLKGGDPLLFGRAEEEIAACVAAGINVEIVPGVSAGFAAAAALSAPLTQRERTRSLTILTPARARSTQDDGENWALAARHAEALLVYMGKGHARRVRDALLAQGLHPALPVILAESVETPSAQFFAGMLGDLEALCARAGDGPALLMIGEGFRQRAQALAPITPTAKRA